MICVSLLNVKSTSALQVVACWNSTILFSLSHLISLKYELSKHKKKEKLMRGLDLELGPKIQICGLDGLHKLVSRPKFEFFILIWWVLNREHFIPT